MFYTQIPCYQWASSDNEDIKASSKYLPLVGIIVGACGGLVYYLTSFIIPHSISVLLAIIATILITGAFHEDGFIDVCDAAGGGGEKEKILDIMKDSRVGSYGVIGITLLLILQFTILVKILPQMLVLTIIAGHSLSRFSAIAVIYSDVYARKDDKSSKSGSMVQKLSNIELLIAFATVLIPLFAMGYMYLILLLPVFIVNKISMNYFNATIGGYTGDCLGFIIKINEVLFYLLVLIVPWKYFL